MFKLMELRHGRNEYLFSKGPIDMTMELFTVDHGERRFWDVTPCGSCKNQHFGGT
jgi:hypothetical protein